LGLLFDHGCDAIVVMTQGISLSIIMGFGNGPDTLWIVWSGAFAFFSANLEEYYMNRMYSAVISPATEGTTAIFVM